MRGDDQQQDGMFSYISPNKRVPQEHPLRRIRSIVDRALDQLSPRFTKLYAPAGPPSVAPAKLLLDEHFTVDGTLLEASASHKSFRPVEPVSKENDQEPKPPAARWDEN